MIEFSVVIPVRNGERYLRSTLESVLAQTCPHFEIVILENCSQDDTVRVITEFADPRIRLLQAREPLTIEENWSRILDLQLNDYMTILSHDDLLYPDYLEEITGLIRQNLSATLYHTHFNLIDENGSILRPCQPVPFIESGIEFLQARHHRRRDSYGTGYVMRSEDYKRVGGIPPFANLMFADDYVWYRLAASGLKVCSPRILFAYRRHEQSEGYRVDLVALYRASAQYLRALEQTEYATHQADARAFVEYTFKGHIRRHLFSLMRQSSPEELQEFKAAKRKLLDWAVQDNLFQPYDLICSAYEWVASSPALRTVLTKPIEQIRRYRHKQRERIG
jgi:glycosyltransferase involved in cell wall biosynthesis